MYKKKLRQDTKKNKKQKKESEKFQVIEKFLSSLPFFALPLYYINSITGKA